MQDSQLLTYSDILSSKPYNLYSNGNLIEGINLFSNLVNTNPHDSNIWVELGFAHLKNIDFNMAKICFETAFKVNPRNSNAICALGLYHYESGNFELARDYFNKTLEIEDSEWAKLNLSILEQTFGNLSKGLSLYEERDKERCLLLHEGLNHKRIPELKNLEKFKKNKSILIIGEQGFGDQIMICLYIKKLKSFNLRVTYLVNKILYPLLKNTKEMKDINVIKAISNDEISKFDFKLFSMSLPFLFNNKKIKRSNLKISKSSLKKDFQDYPPKVKALLSKKKTLVAIAWSGRSSQVRNSYRSVRLKFFEKIFKNPNIEFFVMQKISNTEDLKIIRKKKNLHNFSSYLNDFADTAFLLSKMDLTISICTSLAHLSGLLNKETYLLLSMIHDPRWIKGRNGVIYDSIKTFKQKELNNWSDPLEKINKLLRKIKNV